MVLPLLYPLSLLPGESESSFGGVSPEEGREHGRESKILSQRKDESGEHTKGTSVRWGGGSRRFLLEYVSGRKGKSQGERQLEQPGQKQKEGTNSKKWSRGAGLPPGKWGPVVTLSAFLLHPNSSPHPFSFHFSRAEAPALAMPLCSHVPFMPHTPPLPLLHGLHVNNSTLKKKYGLDLVACESLKSC